MKKTVLMLFVSIALGASAQEAPKCDKQNCKKDAQCEMSQKDSKCCQKGQQCDPFGLSDKDAEKFKVTFEKYMTEMKAVREKHKCEMPEQGKRMDDAQMDKQIKEGFAAEREVIAVKEKYYAEFRKFLTARQTAQLFNRGKGMHKEPGKFDDKHKHGRMMKHCDKKDGKSCEKAGGQCDKK